MSTSPVEYLTPSSDVLCLRCQLNEAVLVTRKEKFCKKCFVRFIRGKQRKSMQDESYKVKYGKAAETGTVTKVLLACSMGSSSLVLLDVVVSLIQEQMAMHRGKTGFELILLNIDEFELYALNKHIRDISSKLKDFFEPEVKFTFKILNINSYILDKEFIKRIRLYSDFHATLEDVQDGGVLSDILALCPNKSSTEDLITIVYDELVLRTAFVENCATVLYGHNMTRIANEIIALTVKGRGSSIHEKVLDHVVNFKGQDIKFIYPLKDVLRAEIEAYADLMDLKQFQLESTKPKLKINRNMTIRDLTTNYFNQLDATGYASTASTVVKTGEKLGAPKLTSDEPKDCQVCGVKIHQNPENWLRRITVNESAPIVTEEEREYVAMYHESMGTNEESEQTEGQPMNICYGCIVTLSSIKATDGFTWPIRNPMQEKEEILNQYILTDDEDED